MKQVFFGYRGLVATAALAALFSGIAPASAQAVGQPSVIRSIPDDTYWGKARYEALGYVTIDSRAFQLAPNVLIRDERNLLVTQYELLSRVSGRLIRFSANRFGMVERIWLLSDQEASEFLSR